MQSYLRSMKQLQLLHETRYTKQQQSIHSFESLFTQQQIDMA